MCILFSNVATNGQNPEEFISVDTGILSAFDEAPTEQEEYGYVAHQFGIMDRSNHVFGL